MHQRRLNLLSAAATVLVLLRVADATSLGDFTPRASNLPPACETLYKSSIDDCLPSDFMGGKCSSTCIAALESLTTSVKTACAKGITGDNILNAMLKDQGVSRICYNAQTKDTAASVTPASTLSTTIPSKSPVIGAGTMILGSASVSSSGLLVDTSSAIPTSTPVRASTASPTDLQSSETMTMLTTMTMQPVAASSAAASGSDVGSNVGILHDAITGTATASAVIESSTTSSSKHAQQTEDGGGGSPFDATSSSVRLTSSLLALLPPILFGFLLP